MGRKSPKIEYIVGIDEVGRGPIAGPVSVGIFAIPKANIRLIKSANDSKKLTEKGREYLFKAFLDMKKRGLVNFVVISMSNKKIDKIGISKCIKLAIEKGLKKINVNPLLCDIRLDGLLKAPEIYKKQKTIIKGDSKEKVIGSASIVAKVTRDRYMIKMSKKYPEYGFEKHKGYGTKDHIKAIKKFGLCDLHRKSFVRSIV